MSTALTSPAPASPRWLTCGIILAAVARHYGVTEKELKSTCRVNALALPRHAYFKLCRELLPPAGTSLSHIARQLRPDMDHTTVKHGIGRITDLMATDRRIAAPFEELRRQLQQQQGTEEQNQ